MNLKYPTLFSLFCQAQLGINFFVSTYLLRCGCRKGGLSEHDSFCFYILKLPDGCRLHSWKLFLLQEIRTCQELPESGGISSLLKPWLVTPHQRAHSPRYINFHFLIIFSTRASSPSYRPQIKIKSVYLCADSLAYDVVNFLPDGEKFITFNFTLLTFNFLKAASSALRKGSDRNTIPGPPPYGRSSTRFLGSQKSIGL